MTRPMPGHISLSVAANTLHRDSKTIRQWCEVMNIPIMPVGTRMRYITRDDFYRVSDFAEANPYRGPIPPPPQETEWDNPYGMEHHTEARKARDAALARRIEAASEWKVANYGAYIGYDEWRIIERSLTKNGV